MKAQATSPDPSLNQALTDAAREFEAGGLACEKGARDLDPSAVRSSRAHFDAAQTGIEVATQIIRGHLDAAGLGA